MEYSIDENMHSEVLESFPGIWFVTIPDGSMIVATSKNHHDEGWRGEPTLKSKTLLPNGLIVNWMLPFRKL
jgi:hypothetical protein